MKAMVLTGPGTPFEELDVPDPTAGPDEAVARVLACGAGLTIQHIRAGRVSVEYPRIIGHEITAEIVETGEGVTGLEVGDAVTAYYYLTCGHCTWCRKDRETLCDNIQGHVGRVLDGGYAEFVKLPARSFMKLPEEADYKTHPAEYGVVTDAIATPVKIVTKARIKADETVAVIGAGGGLGIHMVMVAHWAGAKVVAVDVRPDKFKACRDAGADDVLDVSFIDMADAILEVTNGLGIDVAVDFVGSSDTLSAASRALGKGGRLAILGGGAKEQPFWASGNWIKGREIEILGSLYATRTEVRNALELVAKGELWPLVTEKYPMLEAEQLHQRVEQGLVTGRAALIMT